ncbi:MAG TPA: YicC family protein [Methylophaga sp.]|nr:YicC family protein [Methylophaga sp.]HEC58518.1 YicC family protein [Methylophaga sp.]
MTAFARQEAPTQQGDLTWEIRSVNHRYLEVSLRLDERFRPLEMKIRKLFSDKLTRGKVDAVLRYKAPEQQQSALEVNQDLAKSLIASCDELAMLSTRPAPINMLDILQWPGVLKSDTPDQKTLDKAVMISINAAIEELIDTRETEGAALQQMIEQRCIEINNIAIETRKKMPIILEQHRQRLVERVADLQVNLEPERLEQEIVVLAQKSDVAEELDRLQSHVVEVQNVLKRDEPVGRRLDFLMQELNREANTLASKSIDTGTTRNSVDLKVLIEQMREQIQNIE